MINLGITKVQRVQNGYIQAPGNFFNVIAEEVQRGKPGPFTVIQEEGGVNCHLTIAAFYGSDGKNKLQFVFLANENINDPCRMNNWNLPASTF